MQLVTKASEPKLKFKIGPLDGVTGEELSLETLVDHIILGPSAASYLAVHGIRRMLEKSGQVELAKKTGSIVYPISSGLDACKIVHPPAQITYETAIPVQMRPRQRVQHINARFRGNAPAIPNADQTIRVYDSNL